MNSLINISSNHHSDMFIHTMQLSVTLIILEILLEKRETA